MAWIALRPGSPAAGENQLAVGLTQNAVGHDWYRIDFDASFAKVPLLIAAIQTADGNDPSALRYRRLSRTGVEVMVEEENSQDDEVRHTTEVVGYLLLKPGLLSTSAQAQAATSPRPSRGL